MFSLLHLSEVLAQDSTTLEIIVLASVDLSGLLVLSPFETRFLSQLLSMMLKSPVLMRLLQKSSEKSFMLHLKSWQNCALYTCCRSFQILFLTSEGRARGDKRVEINLFPFLLGLGYICINWRVGKKCSLSNGE